MCGGEAESEAREAHVTLLHLLNLNVNFPHFDTRWVASAAVMRAL